ncbi:MAG TPA: VOC family protein [Nocardia sp.]|uniref:VOC family protein n=1 Tax=Nocardia TaxID=1817 RepID=UPI002453A315|nr:MULTISPECIES: VOC family protein [Nocardia]HLS76167.1 VOC family protein [Nocardia sp.]
MTDTTHTDTTHTDTTRTTETTTAVWPCLTFRDAHAMVAFLTEAFGFDKRAVYTRDSDPEVVEHGELRWPAGGGVMFGSAGKDDTPFGRRTPGNDCLYLVCEDPDGLFAKATAAGAEIVRELRDEDYGSRGFTARDPEGNLWSFGTYRGE